MYKVKFSVFPDLHMDEFWVSDGERRLDFILKCAKNGIRVGPKVMWKN